jgi:hypothetical protein
MTETWAPIPEKVFPEGTGILPNINKNWTFAYNSNTHFFSPVGLDATGWKIGGDISFDEKWGNPARLIDH